MARWNYHPEYEIHLIRKGSGKFIVGDYIGTFEAGHVSLVGSGLPPMTGSATSNQGGKYFKIAMP